MMFYVELSVFKYIKMYYISRIMFIIVLHITAIQTYRHQTPLAQKVWSERCIKNSIVLNDCNWCRCNSKQKYDCKARVCEEIDMFGHFKDAIQEIDVGMEGHGSWRSRPLSCTPGVHYRRGAVVCVCDEDGNWPNPVCRDLFRILHSVEIAGQTRLAKNESCTPTKLYLVGCNVCFCPSYGYLDPQLCTNKECQEDDPVLAANDPTPSLEVSPKSWDNVEEVLVVYAMCNPKYKYKLGCKTCECLINNRLLCDNCTLKDSQNENSLNEYSKIKNTDSICNGKTPFTVFPIGCNLCQCSKTSNIFCTVKKCVYDRIHNLKSSFKIKSSLTSLIQVSEPIDDRNCVPGTKFNRDCNTCVCGYLVNGMKFLSCTSEMCSKNINDALKNDCVEDTFYEENCMMCYCYIKSHIKYRTCQMNPQCGGDIAIGSKTLKGTELEDVNSLSGFCTPMHKYRKDCNLCRCLADGKTVKCSSNLCPQRSSHALTVDIVPVEVGYAEDCPNGHSYQLDCNLCFCLSNGNAICTTAICSRNDKID